MPGNFSRFVDDAVRALAASRGITVDTLRAAAERYEFDPIACALCSDGEQHDATAHRAAVDETEAKAREWRAAEVAREVGRIVRRSDVEATKPRVCCHCGQWRRAGDVMTQLTVAGPGGFETLWQCAFGCDGGYSAATEAEVIGDATSVTREGGW